MKNPFLFLIINKAEYQVTFSYDLNQTSQVKYDSAIKRIGEKFGAKLDQNYEDDYGSKDLIFNSITDLAKLNGFVKEVFAELNKKDVKVHANASKQEFITKISESQIKDPTGFEAVVSGWAGEKHIKIEKNGITTDLIFQNKQIKDEFISNVLPQMAMYTNNFQTPTIEDDWRMTPAYAGNNYSSKSNSHRI